jgi:SWIM zinc finger
MAQQWEVERVVALAPDTAQAAAGRALATPATWSDLGRRADPAALWGRCQGSGRTPYRTVVDLSGPAYNCSCPSRKFPCKHALALMLLWASGQVPAGRQEPPEFAAGWLAQRDAKASGTAAAAGPAPSAQSDRPAPGGGPANPDAAAKRVAQRRERVTAGLEELDQWLCDQIRTGLSGFDRAGYAQIEAIAARMVDAQAPGVAGRLRRLPAVLASGEGWHGRLLEQFALLRLLVRAHRRLAELPPALAAAVRTHVGYPTSRSEVLALAPIRDTWAVLGLRDTLEDRLSTRRIWLRGADTGRAALVLSYAPAGQQFDESLLPGTGVDCELHFYPGGIRALVGVRHGDPGLLPRLAALDLGQALAEYTEALSADPWTVSRPVLLDAVAPVRDGDRWVLREDDGHTLPVARSVGDPWRLVAVSGGEPVTVAGEWAADGFTPLSVVRRQELVVV